MSLDADWISREQINAALEGTWLFGLASGMYQECQNILKQRPHGDCASWKSAIQMLPKIEPSEVKLDQDAIQCLSPKTISKRERETLSESLMHLHPWRKGPFDLFGVHIDTEWRSNRKWNRIQSKIASLQSRTVLDVGCGNGYYLYRMLGQGAGLALGIDPTQLFLAQFAALQRYFSADRALILPMKSEEFLVNEDLPVSDGFDTIFSMGVYYHRRNPLAHLAELYRLLRPGGELVLETLVIVGEESGELEFTGRYAQMRNVWSIPTVNRLIENVHHIGFKDAELIDLTPTLVSEQRSTSWMRFDSLENFLDPNNHAKTIEGHPAPVRATIKAQAL
ncbi:MAG: tRNA 5-methoxyuridine(34)/uridine 5-oxyacetic acid(34) synthase CmoB [Acidiferrobacterales bacterium]|nr:tRNA 5-methoxyuridine(34)/uridine 5-oxyacetic acid(34) synthase CmoB [Acidiferrobacterales bacterium]